MTDSPERPQRPRLWPPSPYQLADAWRCPSCFEVAARPLCTNCGLLLDDPRAAHVVELGNQMLSLELMRQSIMDAIRHRNFVAWG